MTPEEQIDQLVEQVGPNITVPDPLLIRKESARQARARGLAQRVGGGLCAVLLAVGVFAVLNQDQATPVATADDALDDELPAPTTSVPNSEGSASELSEQFEDWVLSNKLDTQITSVRASAMDADPAIGGIRMNLLSFRLEGLDEGREHFAIFSAACGPRLFYGMVEFEGDMARFRKDQLPVSSNIGFDDIGYGCTPPAAARLENILEGNFQLGLAGDGLSFFNDNDGVTFALTDFDWNLLYVDPADETTPTSGVPNDSMSDVMLLVSPSEIFYSERFESLAASYADRCGWLLREETGGEYVEGVDITAEQIGTLLDAIDCEGGLVVRTSGEVLAGELSPGALARLESVSANLPFYVQVDGRPTAPTATSAPTTTEAPKATTTPAPGERGLVPLIGPAQAADRTVNVFSVGVATCNGSPTAEVVESVDEIVVTATSRLPDPSGGDLCLDGVQVELDQPIGDRRIVDGLTKLPVDLLTNEDLFAPKPLEQIPCEGDAVDCRVAFSTPINSYSVTCKSVSEESLIKDLYLHATGVIDGEQVDVIQIKSVGTNIMLAVNIEANCPNSVPNEWSVATKVGNDLDQLSRFLCTLVDLSDEQRVEEGCERFEDN